MTLYDETLLHCIRLKAGSFDGSEFNDGERTYSVPELYRCAVAANLVPRDVPIRELLGRAWDEGESDEPDGSPEFRLRARAANMGFPILVLERGDGTYEIVDGRHRVWRAQELGETRVRAYVLDALPDGAVVGD